MSKGNLNLSSPWVTFYREINEFFKEDPEIKVVFDEADIAIKLYVDNADKAEALAELLPTEKTFGNVVVKVSVIPANQEVAARKSKAELFQRAFKGNPAFAYTVSTEASPFTFGADYIVFANKVVQFFNDNLSDCHGVESTLFQTIAKDVFGELDCTYFCTDVPQGLGKPLGEWP